MTRFRLEDYNCKEDVHILGTILKICLVSISTRGLKEYFNPITKIGIVCDHAIDLKTVETNWRDKHLTSKHVLRVKDALHPEESK